MWTERLLGVAAILLILLALQLFIRGVRSLVHQTREVKCDVCGNGMSAASMMHHDITRHDGVSRMRALHQAVCITRGQCICQLEEYESYNKLLMSGLLNNLKADSCTAFETFCAVAHVPRVVAGGGNEVDIFFVGHEDDPDSWYACFTFNSNGRLLQIRAKEGHLVL